MVSDTSNIPQNDTGSSLGLQIIGYSAIDGRVMGTRPQQSGHGHAMHDAPCSPVLRLRGRRTVMPSRCGVYCIFWPGLVVVDATSDPNDLLSLNYRV